LIFSVILKTFWSMTETKPRSRQIIWKNYLENKGIPTLRKQSNNYFTVKPLKKTIEVHY